METKVKCKIVLREDAKIFLKENHPEAFEIKEIPIKIKSTKSFLKLMHINKTYYDFILNELGFAYLGYFMVLINDMNYDNQVDFKLLKFKGVSDSMIKVCKSKFIFAGLVKKHGGFFYVNPKIAIKGETMNPDIIDLFK